MKRPDKPEIPPAAAVREHAHGKGQRSPEEHAHGPLITRTRQRRLLTGLMEHYDPVVAAANTDGDVSPADLPADPRDLRVVEHILRMETTDTVARAVYSGNDSLLQYTSGDQSQKRDASGWGALMQIRELVGTAAPIVYIYGNMGAGKTNIALLLAQIWKSEHPNGALGSNIRTWQECDKWLPSYGELSAWLAEGTETDEHGGITRRDDAGHKLFIFDEASSHASGRGSDGYQAGTKLGPLVYKIRKANAGMIIIGHDGKDVHPAIRELATCIERYRGEVKRATVWETVTERKGEGKIMELTGIPETDYRYNDGEASYWEWDETTPDEFERTQQLAADMARDERRRLGVYLKNDDNVDMTVDEIATAIGRASRGEKFSRQWVYDSEKAMKAGEL